MNKVDILNLEWTSYPSRDRNTATIVCNYLQFVGLKVAEHSVFRGFEMIDKLHPKILFITNGIGATINFELVKYASLKGIKVVTLTSEGIFFDSEKDLFPFLWGWNLDHLLYEDVNMQWSDRTRNTTLTVYPDLKDKIKTSGGVGFDYYKIHPCINKKEFLIKHKKESFSQIIGVGCWNFDLVTYSLDFFSYFNELDNIRFGKDRDSFNKIILDIIEKNSDKLFLLKEHPGSGGSHISAIEGAENYSNVLILKKEPIADCIAASDFWLTYESTTVIEAWLLGKQTCLLNPSGTDFKRANVHFGSPNYPDVKSLQAAIDHFYKMNELPGFSEMEEERKNVVKNTIQWNDGLNHVRAGNEIIRILTENKQKGKTKIPFDLKKKKWKQFLLSRGFPRKKNNFIYDQLKAFNKEELNSFNQLIYDQQIKFYDSCKLSLYDLKEIKCCSE